MSATISTPLYPGIDVDEDLGSRINTVCGAMIGLSFFTLCLRFFSRWWTKVAFGKDDCFIVIGAVFAWAFSIFCIVQVQQNFYGQHVGKSDIRHIKDFMKALYVLTILYLPSMTLSRLSLLTLYWRIFANSKGKWPIIIASALNILWMIIVTSLAIFSCNPIHGFWDIDIKSKCLSPTNIFISTEAFTIGLDLIVLLMPVYFIKSIKRSLSQRISISSTFLVGIIVTVVSCVRLWRLVRGLALPGFDPTFNEVDAGVWGSVELNVWVLVASVPALRPLFTKLFTKKQTGTSGVSRTYVKSASRGVKARFGLSKSSTAFSLSHEDPTDDFDTLVNPQKGGNGVASAISAYELSNIRDAKHGTIRVDREVDISVQN
ncbi:uncharacterized protein EAE98_010946 [Botrytis deweyae]|uniref:Rhodopsin domain-containing protein n=2 Tax=Botrytis TaxID=33196 RepID=A0A4Z1JIP2_9HELO|nr:uncharacterized protein EAE98_010946 [Botrytis deweyae]KAF7915866.1 hypothetical protein EAE98_010946 [Botrytis deweyae]KAF7923642.1 hypothetical protein EAE99_006901 [Botrytis elliptica]TGO73551.1 hypothetical protein BELL_0351g00010 [Botrytis elliptica]